LYGPYNSRLLSWKYDIILHLSWKYDINLHLSWKYDINLHLSWKYDINLHLSWKYDINLHLSWKYDINLRYRTTETIFELTDGRHLLSLKPMVVVDVNLRTGKPVAFYEI
jgi:hypothetical protein